MRFVYRLAVGAVIATATEFTYGTTVSKVRLKFMN
jgi:hypothetical protein